MVLDGELSSLQTDVLLSSLAPPDHSVLRLNSGKQVLLSDSQRFIIEVHIYVYVQWNLSICGHHSETILRSVFISEVSFKRGSTVCLLHVHVNVHV